MSSVRSQPTAAHVTRTRRRSYGDHWDDDDVNHRVLRIFVAITIGLSGVATGWWAGRTVLEPPPDPLAVPDDVTFTVQEGSVGRMVALTASAQWPSQQAFLSVSGTVTSVDYGGTTPVEQGDVLFTVDLRPVVAARGIVPAFRDLAIGIQGPDVGQLQQLLVDLGYLDSLPDDDFGNTTQAAVRSWQEDLELPTTGEVGRDEIVFLPELPTFVQLDEAMATGARLDGLMPISWVSGEPAFAILLDEQQDGLVSQDATVEVIHDDGSWAGRVAASQRLPDAGQVQLTLKASDDGAICDDQCDQVPLDGSTTFVARVTLIPHTSGPLLPVAAIRTLPDGKTVVVDDAGDDHEVTIVESSDGLAVVDGIELGTKVLLPVDLTS